MSLVKTFAEVDHVFISPILYMLLMSTGLSRIVCVPRLYWSDHAMQSGETDFFMEVSGQGRRLPNSLFVGYVPETYLSDDPQASDPSTQAFMPIDTNKIRTATDSWYEAFRAYVGNTLFYNYTNLVTDNTEKLCFNRQIKFQYDNAGPDFKITCRRTTPIGETIALTNESGLDLNLYHGNVIPLMTGVHFNPR